MVSNCIGVLIYKMCGHSFIYIGHSFNYVYFSGSRHRDTTAGSVAARRDVIGDNVEPNSEVQAFNQQDATVSDYGYMVNQ